MKKLLGSIIFSFIASFTGQSVAANDERNLIIHQVNDAPVDASVNGGKHHDEIQVQNNAANEKESKLSWGKWLEAMKKAFNRTAALSGNPELQVTAWQRFLLDYAQDNPFSDEDEQLRAQAQHNKQDAENRLHEKEAKPPGTGEPGISQTKNTFSDCQSCPEMVRIPEGHLDIEPLVAEAGRQKGDLSLHRVNIKAFVMGKYEVTIEQFADFIRESGYGISKDCKLFYAIGGKDGDWNDTGFIQEKNLPVVCVSWSDAQAYAKWLSKKNRERIPATERSGMGVCIPRWSYYDPLLG